LELVEYLYQIHEPCASPPRIRRTSMRL
jgi:hypothetical protein